MRIIQNERAESETENDGDENDKDNKEMMMSGKTMTHESQTGAMSPFEPIRKLTPSNYIRMENFRKVRKLLTKQHPETETPINRIDTVEYPVQRKLDKTY